MRQKQEQAVPEKVAVIGASGAIGAAFVRHFAASGAQVYAFSRSEVSCPEAGISSHRLDFRDETSIADGAARAARDGALDRVIVATGLLHDGPLQPEKALRDLSPANLEQIFFANTIGPALLAKHFLPHMQRRRPSVFAALSARVGSIADNRLGGWYGYRASKAALNMLIKTAAIEMTRRHKQAIVVGLHPGTVDSELSRPFQKNVPAHKLFSAAAAVNSLVRVMDDLTPADSGKVFAWDGSEIPP